MPKYRIIEDQNGKFYPQTRLSGVFGFLCRWRFLYSDADRLEYPQKTIFVVTDDSEWAAQFSDEKSANEFLKRTTDAVNKGSRKDAERYWRGVAGIKVKQKIKYDSEGIE